ncbi:MAG: hypothetical protein CVV13_06125 [Gammaproteobacteria bacterium HGW-Gammaproteobacteria-3]|nr:MAG: hypothetical protein CVV13_06125 [Gammaproteobacteria bacterium HGW-Gammaproteobacteria-3]
MNQSILTGTLLALVLAASSAQAELVVFPPTQSGTNTGTGTGTGVTSEGAIDVSALVIKNQKPTVSGTVATGDSGNFKLLSSPLGTFGFIDFIADGSFTYQLNNNQAVQNLTETDVVSDVFTFQKTASVDGGISQATITITVLTPSEQAQRVRELVATVIKNEKTEITGNLAGGLGLSAAFVSLDAAPIGSYGFLDFSSDGSYIYTLRNDWPQVQALGPTDAAQDVFAYQVTGTDGAVTAAKLIINVLGNPSVSFDNVEIETNNRTNEATPLNSAQFMRGQLTISSDKDFFVIESSGNEIIHLELCPEGSQCFDKGAWVLYVFDKDLAAAQNIDGASFPLTQFRDDTLAVLNTNISQHLYLLHRTGRIQDSLIGIIDPCFGDTRTVDIGVGAGAKEYLVAISTPLLGDGATDTCGVGDVVLERPGRSFDETTPDPNDPAKQITKTITTTEEFITAFPFIDDQYTLKVTRTGQNPLALMTPDSTTFDAVGRRVNIPTVRVLDQLFSAQLEQSVAPKSVGAPISFDIVALDALPEPLSASAAQAAFNPANNKVIIPQVIDLQTGQAYSVELLFKPEDSTLELLKVTPIQ